MTTDPYITGTTEIAGKEYICQIIQGVLFVDGDEIEHFLERLDELQYRKFLDHGIYLKADTLKIVQ